MFGNERVSETSPGKLLFDISFKSMHIAMQCMKMFEKKPFLAAFLCRFCLGLTRLQGVAMSRDMLRCTSRNKQLNTRFDEVRDCSWADKLDVGRPLVNPRSA